MGVVLPGWADEVLDIIGVSWPNVDEDDYREMANAMREFADDIDEGANEAHTAIQGLVGSAGGSVAVEALNAHWGKINGKHLKGLADCGRMAGAAMDGVAVLIEGAKIAALVQLGILAAEVIAAQAAAPFTLGLSEVGALGATQATRVIVKRLFKEVCQQVAEQVISMALTPVEEALGAMVGDLVVQLGANALGVQDGVDLGHAAKAGKNGFDQGVQDAKDSAKSAADNPMELLSAGSRRGGGGGLGGSGGGGSASSLGAGSGFSHDPAEHDKVVTGLEGASGTFRNKAGGKIGRAKSHHGRTRGKDAIADAANVMLDKVIEGIEDGVKKTAKHLGDNMTRGVKQMSKNHHDNDKALADHFNGLGKDGKKEPKSPRMRGGPGPAGGGKGRGPGKARGQLDKDHPNNATRDDGAIKQCGDPVDVATGRVFLRQTDISLPGTLPLSFVRRFESSYRAGRHLGTSWSSTVDQRLEIDERGIVFVTEDGRLLSYETPEPGERVLPAHGPRWPLMRTDQGDWAIEDCDTGHTRYFAEAVHAPGIALLDEISDRNNNLITFDYDEAGTPLAIRHSAGYQLNLTADAHGHIADVYLADAADDGEDALVVSYGHDDVGNLTSVTYSSGIPTRFEYDSAHRLTAWVDTNESRYEYVYDDFSRCVAQGGTEGHLQYRYDYDGVDPDTGHRVTVATNSLGHRSRYLINGRLQVVAETDPLGNTTRITHDAHDRVLSTVDPLGRTARYTYDTEGRLRSVIRPDGIEFTTTYDAEGLSAAAAAPDGVGWYQEFDDRGNRTTVVSPDGTATHYAYTSNGHLASIADSLGSITRVECDSAGLPIVVTDSLGARTHYQRDAFGRVVSVTDSFGSTTRLTWDREGNLVARIESDGAAQFWSYDGEGNCTGHTDALGNVTSFEYGHFDRMTARTEPNGVRYEFTHDTELQLVQVTSPLGLVWRYQYDPAGRLESESDFDSRTLSYAYDSAGQLISRRNALGQRVLLTHDALGRVIAKESDSHVTTFQYDIDGRLLHAVGPDATLSYQRDAMGRVTSETVNGRTLSFAYDGSGRRVQRITPNGVLTSWAYDSLGRPRQMTGSGRSFDFEYDVMGRETSRQLGEFFSLSQTWNASGRLASQTVTGQRGIVQRREYSYRIDGNLTGIDDLLNGSRRFDLNPVGRVTRVEAGDWAETYTYDAMGNQTHGVWPDRHPSPDARGERAYESTRVVRAGAVRYEYDAQGRLILRQKTRLSRKPDVWRYAWDAEDRLTSVTTPDGSVWRYLYDPLGRRIAKQRFASDGEQVLDQVDFTWDGINLAEQTSISAGSSVCTTLTWDYRGLHPIAQTERKSFADASQAEVDQRFFAIVTDLVGTPTELIDEAGAIAWRMRSTLWGATAWTAHATAVTPLRFPGQYFDAETGLHYNFHRYYDPETARYITPDPLGLAPAPNPSAYVHNPHRWTDPLGLTPCEEEGGTQRPPSYPSVVLGVNPPSDILAQHLRDNGHPDAQTFNGPRYANVEAGTPVWMSNVMGAVSDPRVALHVTLDGMPGAGSTPESISRAFEVAVQRGQGFGTGPGQEHPPSGYGTAWEMGVVARNVRAFNAGQAEGEDFGGRSWDSIHWYSDNQRVHNVPEPDSLRHRRR
ncbi:DUF6531 domain-containing protein [Streptomyces sioyaensis]|uniref:DUF6531 domain-containing protein n=1 Tax=Streptomyces sioyaensis TaxID=67364 RepID=UPI0033CB4B72